MKLKKQLQLTSSGALDFSVAPHFVTRHSGVGGGRLGEFRFADGRRLRTPALFPVFNMLTGPATHGLKQTGGIFKFLKRSVLLEQGYHCYLSEILHFSDFGISPSMLDKWLPVDGSKS